jgi:hypothetical protein
LFVYELSFIVLFYIIDISKIRASLPHPIHSIQFSSIHSPPFFPSKSKTPLSPAPTAQLASVFLSFPFRSHPNLPFRANAVSTPCNARLRRAAPRRVGRTAERAVRVRPVQTCSDPIPKNYRAKK